MTRRRRPSPDSRLLRPSPSAEADRSTHGAQPTAGAGPTGSAPRSRARDPAAASACCSAPGRRESGSAWPSALSPTRSNPVAMTVIFTRPSSCLSTTAPKMMFASSCAASWMIVEASLTSSSDRSGPPVTLMITPRAPSTEAPSSSGLEIARRAASTARFWPSATPVPIMARPMPAMIVFTSAKSRLISPGHDDQVRDSLNRLAQHVVGGHERVVERRVPLDDRQQPLVRDRDDRVDALAQRLEARLALHLPAAPLELERLGHDGDRQRAKLGGEAGDDRRSARAGAAAQARRHEHHVGAIQRLNQLVGVLERRLAADVGIGAGAEPLRQLRADLDLHRRRVVLQRLQVRVGDDELDALEARAAPCARRHCCRPRPRPRP